MFKEIFLFELRYRFKRPATYLYFGILFIYFFIAAINGWVPGSEKAYINSSYVIHNMISLVSVFAIMFSSAIMGVPVYRDIEHDTKGYFMAYPINEKSYLLGRYAGSFLVLFLVCLGAALALMIGSALGPFFGLEDAARFGGLNLGAYINAILVLLLPNLFFSGTLFFCLVALTRKIFVAYTGSVLVFIAYLLAASLTQDIEQRDLADILDIFGLNAFNNATRYWTPIEQNTNLLALTGNILWNRLLWVSIALVLFLYTIFKFSFANFLAVKLGKGKKEDDGNKLNTSLVKIPMVNQIFTNGVYFRYMFRLAWLEFTNIIRDIYFLGILLGGIIFLFLDGWFGNPTFGTPALPMTYYMLEVKDFNYIIFAFIIIIFYTGEVVHRDKSVRFNNIADALPVPNWMSYGSKFLAMVYVCFILVNLVLVCGVLNQVIKGYFNFEFDKYFTDLYLIEFPEYIQLTMLAFFVHVLMNNKFPGHIVSIGVWILMFALRNFGNYDYNLFFYSYTPSYRISDMNGFGHFLKPLLWFNLYWLAFGTLLLLAGSLLWNRGAETFWKTRLKIAKTRLNGLNISLIALFGILWLGVGGYIYYNVSVLNTHQHTDKQLDAQAEWEKAYRKLERVLQPKITDVKLYADIFPEERRVLMRTVTQMTNKWDKPIDTLYVNFNAKLNYLKINGQELKPIFKDKILFQNETGNDGGFWWYKLPKTLNPKDTINMEFEEEVAYQGFPNSGFQREVLHNGTFVSPNLSFGYNASEVGSDKERKKRNLPERKYNQPPQDDPWGLGNFLFNDDADYITYEAIVSTAPDQIAISPGYIQRTWEEKGRKYYHYKMDGEMDMFFNLVSARYQVSKDVWKGENGKEINIEIFHHPTHTYNVDRFIGSVKASMDYFNKYFTPYQYRQMRILEFPRYAGFAQSFPNTVPYSESFGWVGDFSDPNKTDYCFYVTAHEVAHQWWGHQVTPSNTRGANQLSESLAEYSALMVLKKEYGEETMQKFLKYSLDQYLNGRAFESKFEETLMQNDRRAYVWYQKGSLIMYALADYIGEENLNRGLRNFL
nr:peptidase M1 [Thermoflexibacter sp.]